MTGIGVFSQENRSLVVSEYKGVVNTTSDNYVKSIYELLFRHFGVFGEIQDIIIMQFKGAAIISYSHRCMAELAKEAMMLRGLDDNEILTIKWATQEQLETADQDYNTKLGTHILFIFFIFIFVFIFIFIFLIINQVQIKNKKFQIK